MKPATKPARILIDGYNLLFQSQLVGRGRASGWLARARARLLGLLVRGLSASDLQRTEIVFDAAAHGPTPDDEVLSCGLRITFSRDYDEADELIEERIRLHPHPKRLRVVSADNRIIKRAKTRKAVSIDPDQFLDELEAKATGSVEIPPSEVANLEISEEVSDLREDEIQYWMEQFRVKDGEIRD